MLPHRTPESNGPVEAAIGSPPNRHIHDTDDVASDVMEEKESAKGEQAANQFGEAEENNLLDDDHVKLKLNLKQTPQ